MRIVDRGPPQGKVLVATQSLPPGTTILQEVPVILVKGPHYAVSTYLEVFRKVSPAMQREILGFFSPVNGPKATELRAALLAEGSMDRSQVEECVKMASAFNFNSVAVRPTNDDGCTQTDLGIGLYATAGKASHSCLPNGL